MHDLSFHNDHRAVRHILSAPAIRERVAPYVGEDDFDWLGLREAQSTMAGGEALLVEIAFELWHAEKKVGLWEVVGRLDPSNFERVLVALSMSRGSTAVVLRAA